MACDCISLTNKALKDKGVTLKLSVNLTTNECTIPAYVEERGDSGFTPKQRRARPRYIVTRFCPWCGVRYGPAAAVEAVTT